MEKKKKVLAVSDNTKGGKSAMSNMHSQELDRQEPPKPLFKGITHHDGKR